MTGRQDSPGPRRISAVAAALALAVVTVGCYTFTGGAYGGTDGPLRARLATTFELSVRTPSLHFAVSDGAHVALFRISTSGHVRALYPYHPGATSTFSPGAHSVFSSTSYAGGSWRSPLRSGFRSAADYGPTAFGIGRPHMSYVMLVASRAPLRLNRIRRDVPFRYHGVSPLTSPFYRQTPFGSMDLLLDRLIPEGVTSGDWAVDWTLTSVGTTRPRLRRALHIAVRSEPAADDSASGDRQRDALDADDVPFIPPTVPVDLPEVEADGSEGTGRVRVPLPPVTVTPEPRTPPEQRYRVPGVDVDAPGRDEPGRRAPDSGPRDVPGPSEHFGRLFDDGRGKAEGWLPGRGGERGKSLEGPVRSWSRQLDDWARNPDEHSFPEPPRPPVRWRGDAPSFGNPTAPGRIQGRNGRRRGDGHYRPPNASDVHRQRIDVRRLPTGGVEIDIDTDAGGGSGARSSGGSGGDDGGNRREEDGA